MIDFRQEGKLISTGPAITPDSGDCLFTVVSKD